MIPSWSGLHRAVHQALDWAFSVSPWQDELELFVSPADHATLGWPADVRGVPLRTSLGVEDGSVLVFDRRRLRYFREGEQPW